MWKYRSVVKRLSCFCAMSMVLATLLCAWGVAQSSAPPNVQGRVDSGSPRFTDITAAGGVNFRAQAYHTETKFLLETMGSGVALFDYDNDGRLDIYLVNGAPLHSTDPKGSIPKKTSPADWNRLFHQKKDGTFEDVTERSGLQGVGYGMGAAVGDFDNDGFEDLYVTSYGGNHLYHNNGDGTFDDVTVKSATGGPSESGQTWSTSAAWVDLNNDGRLDLMVLRYAVWDFENVWCGEHRPGYRAYCHPDIYPAIRSLVYINNGDGTFTESAQKLGLDSAGKGLGVAIADYDGDGLIDVVVANDSMVEFLFHNKGGGKFEEVGMTSEVAVDGDGRTYAGMGVDFQDYDNDGLPDIVITNLANQKYALYRNNGDGSYTYASYTSGVAKTTLLHSGWGVRFMDYDNDGLKDLLIAQGHDLDTIELNYPQLHYKEPMLLARNVGGGKFVDVSPQAGDVFAQRWVGRGMAIGDLDNDGRLDAVVTTNDGPAHVLHNESKNANHYLSVLLVGHRSNRDAIGARIKLVTKAGAQYQTVSTSGSYLSANDKRVHFGLGSEVRADLMEIRWPSGIVQQIRDLHADQMMKIDEPTAKTDGQR